MGFIKTITRAMEKTIALLRNGTFYLISCDQKQPINDQNIIRYYITQINKHALS